MNDENLIPLNRRSKKAQREIQSKGGKASKAAFDKQKSFKETLKALFSLPMEELEGEYPIIAICKAQIEKAAKGDKASADWVRDTAGEKPVDKQQNELSGGIVIGWETDDKEDRDTV